MNFKREEIKAYALEQIAELKKYDMESYNQLVEDNEIHNEIFNTDYYIVYTYEAEQWLGGKVFDVIRYITEYEEDNFGEIHTDLTDATKVVNMYVYILGEEIIQEILEGVIQ